MHNASFFTTLSISLFYSIIAVMPFPVFLASPVEIFLHRTHRLSAFASNFPFATMVYYTKQQEIDQESQRSDVATGNARWPTQTQTQTQRCGALRAQLALPALQKTSLKFFCVFAWEFGIEKWQGFLANIQWSPLHRKNLNISRKTRSKIRDRNLKNSWSLIKNLCSATFLT